MHPDPFTDLDIAYQQLRRHQPDWVHHAVFAGHGDLDGIVTAIRDDRPNPATSDAVLRGLAAITHDDQRAATVALYALADELRRRLSRAATPEYRFDALSELAVVILEGDTACCGLGHRYVNRAHNRTNKHHRRVRHRGRAIPSTVDPLPTERIIEQHDRQFVPVDIGDVVAARVDLERFGSAIAEAIADGDLPEQTWRVYSDHRLRVIYLPDRAPVPTRQRVAAYRAAKRLQPIIDSHLQGHAA